MNARVVNQIDYCNAVLAGVRTNSAMYLIIS